MFKPFPWKLLWWPAVLALFLSGLLSCSSEDGGEKVVLSFQLDSAKLGAADSLRFEIYNGHAPGPGDTAAPAQVETLRTPPGGRVEITLSDKVQSDFTVVVIGFDSTGAAQRKIFEFDDFEPDADAPPVSALAVITAADLALQPGEIRAPTLSLRPSDAADKRVKLASLDTTVAVIVEGDKDSVKAVAEGTVDIAVTALVGGAQGRFTVTVKAVSHLKSVSAKPLSGLIGDTLEPDLFFDPADAENKAFSLRSLDSGIATVVGNRIFAKAVGKAEVEVTAQDGGHKDTFEVTVTREAIRVRGVSGQAVRGLVGDTVKPDLEWDPVDATDKGFALRSLDTAVAGVAGDALVARALGTARIAITADDGDAADTFDLVVARPGFQRDVLPITALKCAPCHVPGLGLNFQDSVLLLRKGVGALDRLKRDSLAVGKMPLRGAPNGDLTPRQLGVLLDWLGRYVVPVKTMTARDMAVSLGDTVAPDLKFSPDTASNQTFTLTSVDSSLVAVTADNRLLPLKMGETTVLAESDEGGHRAQFKVTVEAPSFARNVLPITTLKCAPCHVPGQTFNFQDSALLVLQGAQALDRLQRDSLAAGKMPLRGSPNGDLSPKEKEILLAWLKSKVVPLKGVSAADDTLLVDESKSPVLAFDPSNASNKSYVLTSEDTSIVAIDGGNYVGKAVGAAKVEVKALDGNHVDVFNVVVKPVPVDSIQAIDTSLAIGESVTPRIEIFPANAGDKTYTLALTGASTIVALAAGNKVTGLAVGKDTLVATSTSGSRKDSLIITVGPVVPRGLTVRDTNAVIGGLVTPTIAWNPTNTTNKTVTYSIPAADTGIAAVRATQILAKAVGRVSVTARSAADTSLRDTFVFTVGPVPVVSITATATVQYPSAVLNARPFIVWNPANATDKGFRLTSTAPTRVSVVTDTTVRTLRLGVTPVTVTSTDGSRTASWSINVIRTPFTLSSQKTILTNKCGQCHGPVVWPTRNWQDSAQVVAFRAAILARIKATDATIMPPAGATAGALTTAQIQTLEAWLSVE